MTGQTHIGNQVDGKKKIGAGDKEYKANGGDTKGNIEDGTGDTHGHDGGTGDSGQQVQQT